MNKEFVISVIKFVVKYVLPAVLGWLEGSTSTCQNLISNL